MNDERPEETTPEEPDDERAQRFAEDFDRLTEAFGDALDSYEQEHPYWWDETLLELLYEGLCNLRDSLNDPTSEVTWDEPFVELQYPLEWNFDGPEAGRPQFLAVTADEIEAAQHDPEARRELAQRMGRAAAEVPRVRLLRDLTNDCGRYVRGETWYPLLPAGPGEDKDLRSKVAGLPQEEQERELARLLRPFRIGPVKWWDRPTLEELQETLREAGADPDATDVLTEEDMDELEGHLRDDAQEAADHPGFPFDGERDGQTFTTTVVAAFHPFVVDEADHRAYYPVVVGLAFEGEDVDPLSWSGEEREAFLESLDNTFEGLLDPEVCPEPWKEGDFTPPTGTVVGKAPPNKLPKRHLAPERVGPPPPERRPVGVSFGITRADARALEFTSGLHQLRLPKRWSNVPQWGDLVNHEVQRLRDDGRDDLLLHRQDRDGRVVPRLNAEAERELRVRSGLGSAGFREVDKDGREYLVRLVQAGGGYVEVGLSWWGLAGPLVEGWLSEAKRDVERVRQEATQLILFEDLERDRQVHLDAMLARVRAWDYGRLILEALLGQVGRQAQNPVEVPAEALRLLLQLEDDSHWKDKVEGALQGLRHLESRLRSHDLDVNLYGYGTALASWEYLGRGSGSHGEGVYYLELGRQFLGCLQVFEAGRRKLRGKVEAVTFDWTRTLPTDERGKHGWTRKSRAEGRDADRFHVFDAGTVFYNAAEELTPEQDNLVRFLERELTVRRDTAAKAPDSRQPWTRKVGKDAEDAHEPRRYDRTFCPLLPEDQCFHAALGHFTKNAEAGRTLGGTPRRAGKTGGAHHGGLLHELGYLLEPGGATEQRRRVVEAALVDLRTVVVDYLGGMVTARALDGAWLTAEEAQGLPWEALVYRTRWFLFLPETWREDRKQRWEERTGYRATEDEAEARAIREARWAGEEDLPSPVGGRVGPEGLPLYQRLHMAMRERDLTLQAVGDLFGVSKQAVSLWSKGTEPNPETGAVSGKPIPAELRPLVERWVTTGEPPTPDELAARRTRRSGRRKGPSSTSH